MPQENPTTSDESAGAGFDAPKSLREYAQTTVINTVPPVLAYYGLRMFGVTPYLALVGAIVVATLQGLSTVVRKRKIEFVNVAVLVCAAVSLAVAFTTKNPRIVQVTELIPATFLVWSVVASGVVRKPTSKMITGAIAPGLADAALPQRGWTDQDIRDWHRLHTRLCVRLGLICGMFPVAAVACIFTLPVDISQILIVTVGPTLLVVCIASATTLLRRFVRRTDEAAADRAAAVTRRA
ncbi:MULTISPECIES: VC0807 family protein [Mycobacterium]|uniref:DUF3159 domain-containing protein n=1 Tax=Mycobacterium kiyosense TaxID=2871094 RepID=A0A9P3QAV0_9MYCO|nr:MULTISPECIES: VC0807 family protein [Mycobacterium]BDB45590.1 hypothetical protein IWGMT90018_60360 [Mycobacterium kiyosense]BDE11212.1 hypothetical protein MKCMC460_00720 [Mycobacterium sp. 20KCMC460]GLB85763.1 hypothetical protein SRL2020028_50190 [Mycobacterium kiyosense]GLB92421.1 hypothetical protein SRL2020130_52380 [Mycobacterium kiyosense]GLB98509.1 hypothetical protein SRL2020226_52850 [Mycobacterium kiyosense]